VIVSLHVATGALVGAAAGSRLRAVVAGALAHVVGDAMPHRDFPFCRFGIATGTAGVLALAAARGPLHPITVGALAASLPDVGHVLALPRPRGRKLFPSHRFEGWHREGGVSAPAQLVAAALILAALVLGPKAR
jgi:hypothetical protein